MQRSDYQESPATLTLPFRSLPKPLALTADYNSPQCPYFASASLTCPLALSSHHTVQDTPSPTATYWDNACSFHTVNNLDLLYNTSALSHSFSLGGVGGPSLVTHRGYLRCLPHHNNMNVAYYAPTIPVNLFSLGHLQRCGASYGPDPLRPLTHFAVYSSSSGPLLAYATLSTNNLLLVDFDALNRASTISPLQYHPSYALNTTFPIHHIVAMYRTDTVRSPYVTSVFVHLRLMRSYALE
jgi:hypothetical protein